MHTNKIDQEFDINRHLPLFYRVHLVSWCKLQFHAINGPSDLSALLYTHWLSSQMIYKIFLKIRTGFCSISTFSQLGVIFCMSYIKKVNTPLTILVAFDSRGFRLNVP